MTVFATPARTMLIVALAWLLLAGCVAPTPGGGGGEQARLLQVAREVPGAEPRWQQQEPAEAGMRVWRGGRAIAARLGMRLAPGDEIDTGDGVAILRFAGTGDVLVDVRSRVRIGSLEVLFGRIFADVRGFFQGSSENVTASVEGTRFLFEVRPDRGVHVAVAEGAVSCRSRDGAWAPIRLQAQQALLSNYPNRDAPRLVRADRREFERLERLWQDVAAAPARGWCCVEGRVAPAWSTRCSGSFFEDRERAIANCRPPRPIPDRVPPRPPPEPEPEPRGYCCLQGQVTPTTRSQCGGRWSLDPKAAYDACRPVIR